MFEFVLGFLAGLVVGWNLLPQPAFVKDAWSWVVGKIKEPDNK